MGIKEISNRIDAHYDTMIQYKPEEQVVGVLSFGSMNYGLYQTGISDVDTKGIYIPSIDDLYKDRTPHTLTVNNGEFCTAMDLQHFFANLYKQNINFLELLYADYYKINWDWADLWGDILDLRDDIADMDPKYAIMSISGQALHTLKQARMCPEGRGKKYANCLRLRKFLITRYKEGRSFEQSLKSMCFDTYWDYRTEKILPDETLNEFLQTYFEAAQQRAKDMVYTDYDCRRIRIIKDQCYQIMREATVKFIKESD